MPTLTGARLVSQSASPLLQDPRTGEQVERNLWVTRKGATSAREGQLGIIPGSMGTGSFIVKGGAPGDLCCQLVAAFVVKAGVWLGQPPGYGAAAWIC